MSQSSSQPTNNNSGVSGGSPGKQSHPNNNDINNCTSPANKNDVNVDTNTAARTTEGTDSGSNYNNNNCKNHIMVSEITKDTVEAKGEATSSSIDQTTSNNTNSNKWNDDNHNEKNKVDNNNTNNNSLSVKQSHYENGKNTMYFDAMDQDNDDDDDKEEKEIIPQSAVVDVLSPTALEEDEDNDDDDDELTYSPDKESDMKDKISSSIIRIAQDPQCNSNLDEQEQQENNNDLIMDNLESPEFTTKKIIMENDDHNYDDNNYDDLNNANLISNHRSEAEMAEDAARKRNEMNAFAAMANADVVSNNPSEADEMAKDAARRRNEMNAFAAMANADTPYSLSEDEIKRDEARRKSEMSAFAAMANADVPYSPSEGEIKRDEERRKSEMSAFAAMANADVASHSPGGNEMAKDVARRQNEMNAFAAMANADIPYSPSKDEIKRDEARRKSEMSAFAAMANADLVSNNPSEVEFANDAARRRNEMSAFAAMANADLVSNNPSEGDIAKDAERRQNEMNTFAAMANADIPYSPREDEIKKDEARRKSEMSAFAAMANADVPYSPSEGKIKRDEALRNAEMSSFAAMANADVASDSPGEDEMAKDAARRQNEMNAFAALANADLTSSNVSGPKINQMDVAGASQDDMNYFTASSSLLQKDNIQRREGQNYGDKSSQYLHEIPTSNSGGGTFVSAKSQSSGESNRNLDAALASLASQGDSEKENTSDARKSEFSTLGSLPEIKQVKQRKPQHSQMYSECVRVAKPSFFGSCIHPRILNEAKEMQSGSSHLLSNESNSEMMNLESVFAVFGQKCGIEVSDRNRFVTLYEPVWGDFQRLHREDRILGIEADSTEGMTKSKEQEEKKASSTKPKSQDDKDAEIRKETIDNSHVINASTNVSKSSNVDSSDLFLKYARGDIDGYGKSMLWEKSTLPPVSETDPADLNCTFRQISNNGKGSFEGSELMKQVGLNENLSKALKQLSDDSGLGGTTAASLAAADAGAAAIEAARAISVGLKDGRPLSNLEMVGGRVPLYGCDDAPLPVPNDLGIFETKEDQYQSIMEVEAQDMIASRAVPNIFGSIVCPSNCSGPDDSQSWFSNRNSSDISLKTHPNGNLSSTQFEKLHYPRPSQGFSNIGPDFPTVDDKSDLPSPLRPPPPSNRQHQSVSRTHISRESNISFGQHPQIHPLKHERSLDGQNLQNKGDQRIGWWNISDDFGLKPKKQKSRNKDSKLSSLQLPPSRNERRLDFSWAMYPSQDKLVNENRSFAELHPAVDTIKCLPFLSDRDPNVRHVQIETQIVSFPSIGEIEPFFCSMAIWHVDTAAQGTNLINWENSGRITEFLHFDVVNDHEVEESCSASLWPYLESNLEPKSTDSQCELQGTRCGVFPLHSRYDMENLHAVLIVHKTLSEESDVDIYLNSSKQKVDEKNQPIKVTVQDLERYRQRAGKAAERFGQLLMPFAFGVAPLVQIIGSNPPKIPASRAAQIPLFKFIAGERDDPIISHILAVGSSGHNERIPAELANDGTAMLVLRNFGYLGLHSSIHPHSKLACDRLVDFTGDKQVRRRRPDESVYPIDNEDGHIYVVDAWHKDFVGEPTIHGGRSSTSNHDESEETNSVLYSQELVQIPINNGQSVFKNAMFHTSLINEIIIGPRALQNCAKRNIAIKMEIRRLQCTPDKKTYVVLPDTPMIHNTRRGPFLVDNAFTSCAYHKVDPRFLDEFKVKLPLNLNETKNGGIVSKLVAFFSVYHVSVKGKKKWSIMTGKGEDDEQSSPLELLGCGYLPLSSEAGVPCLVTDGIHNVKLEYIAKEVSSFVNEEVDEIETTEVSIENDVQSCSRTTLLLEKIDTLSKPSENNEDDTRSKYVHNMILLVESTALSSVHVQNPALAKYFQSMPQAPRCKLQNDNSTFEAIFSQSVDRKNEERKLLQQTIDVATSNKCPISEWVAHFLRINNHLWRSLVSGQGEPNSEWANPGSLLALRVYSFSSLLQILNGVCHYLMKHGVTDLNGKGKWNMVSMSKIVLMLFDEDALLPGPLEKVPESFDDSLSNKENTIEKEEDDENEIEVDSNLMRALQSLNKLNDSTNLNESNPKTEPIQQSELSKLSSQDDIALMNMGLKPSPLRARSSSAPNAKGLKIDTKSDFQTALNYSMSPSGSPFGGSLNGPAANRRKWMTLPSSSLTTIHEDNDKIEDRCESTKRGDESQDALDSEMFKTKAQKVKQFRVPKLQQTSSEATESSESTESLDKTDPPSSVDKPSNATEKVVPKTDEEIENAGTAFLDMIGKNYGYDISTKELGGEEKRVGVSHHRKTKSRCSVDWSLPPTDLLIENYQEMEIFNRSESRNLNDSGPSSIISVNPQQAPSLRNHKSVAQSERKVNSHPELSRKKGDHPIHKQDDEEDTEQKPYPLPSFKERMMQLHTENEGRWFPYTYEVIILQWASILAQQTKRKQSRSGLFVESNEPVNILKEAAYKARGVSIACAPILFDVIKKSLSFRINSIFDHKRGLQAKDILNDNFGVHPLVSLDDSLFSTLMELIKTITDACIDVRNFDSWSFRRTSIIVNDSIARFLRDLFALLDTKLVHQLVLTYFQRFVLKDGKQSKDRDSKIGLRCSWEICKMRLNSITLFIRFADFIKVNRPLMMSWGPWSLGAPNRSTRRLFTKALIELEDLNMPDFALEGPTQKTSVKIPELKSHWLLELVIDICLSATGHVEQNIQHRAAALLHELFWTTSVEGKINGSLTVLASMYVPFIRKILNHTAFLASLTAKSQLRKDILTCVVFVMQSAPFGLLRALWRNLCLHQGGRSNTVEHVDAKTKDEPNTENTALNNFSILDICGLLNLCLKTFEYEGSESNLEEELGGALTAKSSRWQREFLLAPEEINVDQNTSTTNSTSRHRHEIDPKYTSTSSRKWFSHDIAIVIINVSRNIVREYLSILRPTEDYDTLSGPIAHYSTVVSTRRQLNETKNITKPNVESEQNLKFSYDEKVKFARAISSVYLNCLSLRQSDIVFIKTLTASIEILKVFGIELFLSAVGETLQHWMRVILVHCGARRAKVRVEAIDFLFMILRLTWDSYGSFFRVRVPLLAVQTEVMERIVATAASRYYKEQRRLQIPIEYLSNQCAEAALTPLWRTIHRLHHTSASNNAAFKSALELLATRMKTLYKAYIAAHALAIVTRTNSLPKEAREKSISKDDYQNQFQVKRVVMESACFSKNIVGSKGMYSVDDAVTHNEVVEDSFLAAAHIFSPTELPLHRIAWLRKLAEFHSSCNKVAEEGACRLEIHKTLKQAVKLHGHLWSSIPFWPWASDSDGIYLKGEGPTGNSGHFEVFDDYEDSSDLSHKINGSDEGKYIEQDQSFRRIFYRVANSVRMKTGDWDIGGNRTSFYGVTFASEYDGVPPWTSLREIEEDMVEEAEAAGELFLQAGLIESSRFCWSLATNFYSKVFNYPKLSYCYRKLALVVASQVPIVDSSNQLEVSSPLGRFYRVYFHGSAADELMGKEFVYRASISMKLEEFCNSLCRVLTSILPDKTPINLVLDDGRPQEPMRSNQRRPLGAVPREAITIKVTPLRALLKYPCPRGTSEWFYRQLDGKSTTLKDVNTCFQTSSQSQHSSVAFGRSQDGDTAQESEVSRGGVVIGVNKFSFTQHKDRERVTRDILKTQSGIVVEKSLKVTELQVERSLPNCVTRQPVIQRTIFNQSPLEASIEVVCSWCAVLFQTAVATNGLAVIGTQIEYGIGNRAEKVVADCIHKSRVKEIGRNMLNSKRNDADQDDSSDESITMHYEKLTLEEIQIHQKKLARAITIFMELLHVLVGRNRDLLLTALDDRKRRDLSSNESCSDRGNNHPVVPPSPGQTSTTSDGRSYFHEEPYHGRGYDDGNSSSLGYGGTSASSTVDRTDKAMAIQRELQRAFIAMCKVLQPIISRTIHNECPRWMKMSCQDNYFSGGFYRQARIAMGEELLFFGNTTDNDPHDGISHNNDGLFVPLSILPTQSCSSHESEESSTINSKASDSHYGSRY